MQLGLSASRERATRDQRGRGAGRIRFGCSGVRLFCLEDASCGGNSVSVHPGYVSAAFKETSDYWRRWVARSTYRGRWRGIVNRSALVLKLLTSSEQGSIIVALTFGLPEEIGGIRNWDYRYTWLRDAAFTVYAFLAQDNGSAYSQ
jgi:Glycosyl hydrolases family 15